MKYDTSGQKMFSAQVYGIIFNVEKISNHLIGEKKSNEAKNY